MDGIVYVRNAVTPKIVKRRANLWQLAIILIIVKLVIELWMKLSSIHLED
jgi:hypothetical protein